MPHTEIVPLNSLRSLAGQISQWGIPTLSPDKWKLGNVELAEAFPIWVLPLSALEAKEAEIASLAINADSWHHQIKFEGKALFLARSWMPEGTPETLKLMELSPSQLAERIDNAINWTDEKVKDDSEVRLLLVPAFNLTAFWFLGGPMSRVLVIDAPLYPGQVPMERLLESKEFLDLLHKLPPIRGRRPGGTPDQDE
jgi:hypothetical protein